MSETGLRGRIETLERELRELYALRRAEIAKVATTSDPVNGKRPLQKDVAKLFGVKVATVNRALHWERRRREREEKRGAARARHEAKQPNLTLSLITQEALRLFRNTNWRLRTGDNKADEPS